MLNVIRGKKEIREMQKLLDMGMGPFYVSIWIKKHLQKYDQE